jgi:serine/threonine-protein kinase HipA
MRQAAIKYKDKMAGTLTQHDDGSYSFRYLEPWLSNPELPPISLGLPKSKQEYHSSYLFPFFYNMLPEGTNKQMVCNALRIDPDDYLSLLLQTARYDTIGAITVEKI